MKYRLFFPKIIFVYWLTFLSAGAELVAYYPFEGNAQDASGNGYNGSGDVEYVEGIISGSQAAYFNGSQRLELPSPFPDMPAGTLSVWIRPEEPPRSLGVIFCDSTNVDGRDFRLSLLPGLNTLRARGDKPPIPAHQWQEVSLAAVNTQEWFHVAYVFSEASQRVYINGILVNSSRLGGVNVGHHASRPTIGSNSDWARNYFFKGGMDQFRIYNRVLSAQEVSALYRSNRPTTYILATTVSENGSVGGAGNYSPGAEATVTATPDLGYLFTGWSGDASGTENPLTLVMDQDQSISPIFERDSRDFDNDGLSNYEELVIHRTAPNNADSDGDGVADAVELADQTDPNDATDYSFPQERLVNVTFDEDLTEASLELTGLVVGRVYHVAGTVDGESFFRFSDSDFTATAADMVIAQPVNVLFRSRLLLKLQAGPSIAGP